MDDPPSHSVAPAQGIASDPADLVLLPPTAAACTGVVYGDAPLPPTVQPIDAPAFEGIWWD